MAEPNPATLYRVKTFCRETLELIEARANLWLKDHSGEIQVISTSLTAVTGSGGRLLGYAYAITFKQLI